jgi:hypothetical protein
MNIHDVRQLESTAALVARSEHEARAVTVATVPPTPDTEPGGYSSLDFNPKTVRGAPPPLTVGPIFGNSSVPEKYSVILADGCVTYGGKLPEESPTVATDELYGVDYITVDGSPGDILYCHFILEQENESEPTEIKTYKFLRFEFSTSESPESLTDGQESLTFRIAKLGGAPWSTHQYVVGALHIGGGGGGGSAAANIPPVDDVSVELSDLDGVDHYSIKGWHDQDAEYSNLSGIITTRGDERQGNYQVLVRDGQRRTLKYLPLGGVHIKEPESGADDVSDIDKSIVGVSLRYISDENDEDSDHLYCICLTRGKLTLNNGELSITRHDTQYIPTTPISEELMIPSVDYGEPTEP